MDIIISSITTIIFKAVQVQAHLGGGGFQKKMEVQVVVWFGLRSLLKS